MVSRAAARYLEQQKQQRAEIQARVAKAKATCMREEFDFEVFAKLYDVTQDHGSAPITPEVRDRYEEEYYLSATHASTMREFVAWKEELKLHDAN